MRRGGRVPADRDERAACEAEARRQAEARAAEAEQRAARLAAKLRELGLDSEEV